MPEARDGSLVYSVVAVVIAGAALAITARSGATALLVAVAILQGLLAPAWVVGTAMPGRWGGVLLAALAAAGADVAVSVRPEGRLGVLLPVLGLAVAAMFVHQLSRGAARVHVVASLSAIALLLLAEISAAALLQLRHEFSIGAGSGAGGRVAAAAVASVGVALAVSFLVDLVLPVPRFDPDVARGVLALVAGAGAGAAVGVLLLGDRTDFAGGRAAFVGGGLAALAALLAVASGFLEHGTAPAAGAPPTRAVVSRAVFGAVLPLVFLMPVAFLLCLVVRT